MPILTDDDRNDVIPGVTVDVDVKDNYKNMKEVLKDHPQLTANALEAKIDNTTIAITKQLFVFMSKI